MNIGLKFRFIAFAIVFLIASINCSAQLSGVVTVPGTYSSIATAVNAINTLGINGSLTVNIAAGYNETAPVGGLFLTTTGTSLNPIIFQKSGIGANPVITAYTGGTATPSSPIQDGVWRLVGTDYITIDGIDIYDPNTVNPSTMEYGYAMYKASATDGCQNNVIKNCRVILSNSNNQAGIGPSGNGSCCIIVTNAIPSNAITDLIVTVSAGANSNNKFYSNTVANCNIGILLTGYSDTSPYLNADRNNDVGGSTMLTGNVIQNFGGATGATVASVGIKTGSQYDINISNNYLNNNIGTGTNHKSVLWGIYNGPAPGSNIAIENNTVTVKSDATTAYLYGIENASGGPSNTNTISISNNVLTNCSQNLATTAWLYGIYNNTSSASVLNINNNALLNNNSASSNGGVFRSIYVNGNFPVEANINNNTINGVNFSDAMTLHSYYGIYFGSTGVNGILRINSNTFQGIYYSKNMPSSSDFLIYNSSVGTSSCSISNNSYVNINVPIAGALYMIFNNGAAYQTTISGNSVVGTLKKTGSGGWVGGFYSAGSIINSTITVTNNNFSNISVYGNATFYGIYHSAVLTTMAINNNTITNITGDFGMLNGMYITTSATGSRINNNIVSNIYSGGFIGGLRLGTSSNNYGYSVYSNTISSIKSSGNSDVIGILSGYGSSITINNNKIYDISNTNSGSGGRVMGISIQASSANSTHNIINNLIGDLRAPNSNNVNYGVIGIDIESSTAANSSLNISYNTINLNAISSGLGFSAFGIYHTANSTATTNRLLLKNNLIINNSTPKGSGLTGALQRSSSTLANYDSQSNNNIFYAGTPGPNNIIYGDGTNAYQTITAFKTAVSPRESGSFTENTPVLTTVGASTAFLNINNYTTTVAESGAINIAGITADYDNDIRQGNAGYIGSGAAPDIGADEFEFSSTPCSTVNAGIISPTLNIKCYGQSQSFTPTGVSSGTGITYQWMVSSSPGGPYTNVTSGTGANSFAYSPGNVLAGTYYYVMVATCSSSLTSDTTNEVKYVVNPLPSLTISSPNTVCTGSVLTLSASGAVNYVWNTSAITQTTSVNPTGTSIYYVYGTDINGCTTTAIKTVSLVPIPVLSISGIGAICYGGTSTLTASGGITYTWSTSSTLTAVALSPTINTTYTVLGTDTAGCIAYATKQITVNPLPVLNITTTNSLLCIGQLATLTASGALNYTWTPGGTTSNIFVNPTTTTSYTILGKDGFGCIGNTVFTQSVSTCTSIDEALVSKYVSVFPNPNNGEFNIYLYSIDKNISAEIYNSLGQLIKSQPLITLNNQLNIKEFPNGIYFVKVLMEGISVHVMKIIKE